MYASPGILIFGHDLTLIKTRALILEKVGFEVWTATDAPEAIQTLLLVPSINLFVLCQTISSDECKATLTAAHALRPSMNNLILGINPHGLSTDARDTFLTKFLDPASFVKMVQHKIGTETAALLPN